MLWVDTERDDKLLFHEFVINWKSLFTREEKQIVNIMNDRINLPVEGMVAIIRSTI